MLLDEGFEHIQGDIGQAARHAAQHHPQVAFGVQHRTLLPVGVGHQARRHCHEELAGEGDQGLYELIAVRQIEEKGADARSQTAQPGAEDQTGQHTGRVAEVDPGIAQLDIKQGQHENNGRHQGCVDDGVNCRTLGHDKHLLSEMRSGRRFCLTGLPASAIIIARSGPVYMLSFYIFYRVSLGWEGSGCSHLP